jgi:hypothetical protein
VEADWFEMKQIRSRRMANAVWIPLRAVEAVREEGQTAIWAKKFT